MNDSASEKRPRGTRWCSTGNISAAIGLGSLIIGLGAARFDLIGPLTAFSLFGVAMLAFLVCLLSLTVGLILSKGSGGATSSELSWLAFTLAVLFFGTAFVLRPDMSNTAPIHDISTDLGNPPVFDAVLVYREGAQNPPEYAGGDTAKLQREAYPDIQTLMIEMKPDKVLTAAEQVANDMGWEVVDVDRDNGRMEAIATTSWFRFKDDVSIRLADRGYGTYIDIRSKSRIGRGDMGANAARIREFLQRLTDATAE
jgi:uncharacterized protein (DUF1499 family)